MTQGLPTRLHLLKVSTSPIAASWERSLPGTFSSNLEKPVSLSLLVVNFHTELSYVFDILPEGDFFLMEDF